MRLKRFARVAALLTPLACSDGTGPPANQPLPDNLTSGTINVREVVVPAGKQHIVEGDVVVIAENDIHIDGDIVVMPGASLALAAGDSLIINGSVGGPAAAVQTPAIAESPMTI